MLANISSPEFPPPAAAKKTSPRSFAPMALKRRQRCTSCSDKGNFVDLSLDEELLQEPDIIVTRRTRTNSVSGRIKDDVQIGSVKYFCRSRGHGFINPDNGNDEEIFMHISDIEGEFVPRKGDKVQFRLCPIPPRFDKFQAVHVHIVNFTPEVHHKWEIPETPEEMDEEEQEVKSLPFDV